MEQQEIIAEVMMLPKQNPINCIGLIKCIKEWRSLISPEEDFSLVGDIHWGRNVSQGVFEYWEPQDLYFVSDEEIKESDWFIDGFNKIDKFNKGELPPNSSCKKIIASTNPDLGLPTIPLTWIRDVYVPSNGSIKEVKLEIYYKQISRDTIGYTPAHEPIKMGKYEQTLKLTPNNEVVIVDEPVERTEENFPEEYMLSAKELQEYQVDQELEDAADNWVDSHYNKGVEYSKAKRGAANPKSGFIAGAEWQKEQSANDAIEFSKWWFNNGFTYNRKENHWRKYPSEKRFTDGEMIELFIISKKKENNYSRYGNRTDKSRT